MKKIVLSCLCVLSSLGLFAQSNEEILKQDPCKAACSFYVYDYKTVQEMTPAPEGYQPFYISHFARHGARYCTSEYSRIYNWFSKASAEGLLTDAGKDFFARYEAFYNKVKDCSGNLTGIGKEQHRTIARNMYQRFPSVFEGPTHVEAVSTESPRVIMSMWSCLSELVALDQDIDLNADASGKYASWLQPALASQPYYIKGAFSPGKSAKAAANAYFEENVPWKTIVEKFFVNADVLTGALKATPEKFIGSLHAVVTDTYCLDEDQGIFDDVFTSEELYKIWKGLSAHYFLDVANYENAGSLVLDYSAFTLGQIIESADADIASGAAQLRLRFGHDSGIAPLITVMNLNGYGRKTASFEEGLDIFPSYCVPMGASVQLIFYRNAEGEILVKVLLSEKEAQLPFEPLQGPYYRWSDFKAYYLPRIKASKAKINNILAQEKGLASLKSTDWGWKALEGTKVETGGATVNVFGSMQTISMVRFPIKSHVVSVYDSQGANAAVTSALGEAAGAIAAINASFFDKKKVPTEYVKDEGKVVCDRPANGASRSNGMLRIKDKKGRSIDILTVVDSATTVDAANGWREAIVSGPVLIEDGKIVDYLTDRKKMSGKFYPRRHPRTLMGYTEDGWVYFIVVDGRFPGQAEGMTVLEMQILCQSLGLYEAMNLDGGGSSTLWTKEFGVMNHPYDNKVFDHKGERKVPNALIVK